MTALQDRASDIERNTSVRGIWHEALDALAAQGVDFVIYLTVNADRRLPFVLTNVPEVYDLMEPETDPFIAHCCDSYDVTLTGPDYLADYDYLPDRAKAFIRHASATGWRTGLGIPMRLSGTSRFGGFNLGTNMDRDTFERRIVPRAEEFRFFCLLVHRRIEELRAEQGIVPQEDFRDLLVAPENPALEDLSPREREVIYLVARGISRKECARLCGISPNTVAEYAKNAYRKLGVQNRVEVARLVLQRAG